MSKEGGLLLLSTTSPHHEPTAAATATILDRFSKFKISDDPPNHDDKNSRSRSISSTTSSGIGSGEFSPTVSGNLENSASIIDQNQTDRSDDKNQDGKIDHRRSSTSAVKNAIAGIVSRDNDVHARSLTISTPANKKNEILEKKLNSQNQRSNHLSPAEFFQMSRIRASALANKLNTAATFGGSKDFVISSGNIGNASGGLEIRKSSEVKSSDVDDLVKKVADALKVDDEKIEKIEKEEKQDENKSENEAEKEKEKEDACGELIGRSPVPVYSNNRHVQHPYKQSGKFGPQATPQPTVCPPKSDTHNLTPADYLNQQRMRATAGAQYPNQQQFNQNFDGSFGSVQPNFVGGQNQNGYTGGNAGQNQPGNAFGMAGDDGNYQMAMSPFEENVNAEFTSNLNEEFFMKQQQLGDKNSQNPKSAMDELPEALSDFILKYSRRYSTSSTATTGSQAGVPPRSSVATPPGSEMSSGCVSGEPSPISSGCRRPSDSSLSGGSGGEESGVEDDHMSTFSGDSGIRMSARPESAHSSVFLDSPKSTASFGSIPPTTSPAAPMATQLMKIEEKNLCSKYRPLRPKQSAAQPQQQTGQSMNGQQQIMSTKAKQKLRELIPQHEFDAAWAWAMRCCQACPGSLMFRDADGDSLLHIVIWHKDLAKIYAVTEILMKDDQITGTKPIDTPNKLEETPIFLAVEKRIVDVVAYLLECGANPNLIARNHDGDGPLHYAAARGMSEIVQLFCSCLKTNFNLLNGSGMTPLLCAVKNHGVIEEESQCLVNNKPTIRTLLKVGADPKIPDVASGKSVLHYCVERMDPDLVELFRDHLTKDAMCQLVNMPDYNGDTPLHILSRMIGGPSTRTCSGAQTFTRGEGEEELRRKMLNTLIDCGADVTQCAGGVVDFTGNGDFILLYPGAEQDAVDDIQFTILDSPKEY